jgi:hypothetical protein
VRPARRPEKPRRDRRDRREPARQPRTGAYEKRAAKTLVPITKAMEEGKEFLRSFGDLLQYHQKKKQQESTVDKPPEVPQPDGTTNGTPAARQGDKETGRQGDA